MIVRVVRMTFREGSENDFLLVFETNKDKIRSFDGCSHLDLLRDIHNPNIFTTYSHWDNEECLNAYRDSVLFLEVWAKTKQLFSDSPEAHSYTVQ